MGFDIHTELLLYPKTRQVGPRLWRIKEDFIGLWSKRLIVLKTGFEFDGASIPRLFWSVVGSPMSGRYTAAAAVHDGLYAVHLTGRLDADRCMYDLARQYGTLWITAQTMLRAVQACGWVAWARNQESGKVENTRNNNLVEVVNMTAK